LIGVSQERFGAELGMTFQQIQKYENGTNRISSSKLQQIARILSVPITYFFEGAPGGERAGSGKPDTRKYVVQFLSSSEGFRLNEAFARIGDPKVRQSPGRSNCDRRSGLALPSSRNEGRGVPR
jgi:transcriptional regulator with XRE-family HTH domain